MPLRSLSLLLRNMRYHINQITATHIRLYYIHLPEKELSSHTIHTCARAIRAFLNFCVKEDLLDKSPMAKVGLPQRDKLQPNYLTAVEVLKLLAACQTERECSVVLVLLDTGLRATELVNLNGGDIDPTSGAIAVRQGKGRKDRTVFIGNRTRKQLLRYYRKVGKPDKDAPLTVGSNSRIHNVIYVLAIARYLYKLPRN